MRYIKVARELLCIIVIQKMFVSVWKFYNTILVTSIPSIVTLTIIVKTPKSLKTVSLFPPVHV